MKFHLDTLITEYESLEHDLADPAIYSDLAKLKAVNQKKKSLELTITLYREYKNAFSNLDDAKEMLQKEKDADMIDMIQSEITSLEEQIPKLEEALRVALLPKDPNDEKNIFLEIRAGAGGDEA